MAITVSDENDYEWEYEYDDTQTETVYVTLDLPYQRPPELKSDHLTTKQSQPRPNVQADSDQEPVGQSSDEGEADDDEEQPQVHASDDEEEPGNESQGDENSQPDEDPQIKPAPPKNSVQILDLHTRNPLISYNEQVYSCTWGRTIGTDLIFAQPGTGSKAMTPLVQEEGFDLVASSRIKLRGKPVYLERKKNATTTMPLSTLMGQIDTPDSVFVNSNAQEMSQIDIPSTAAARPSHAGADTNPAVAVNAAQTVANSDITTTSIKDPQAEAHIQERNAWLQRFSEIRQQRGESANIPIRIGKSYIDWVPNPAKSSLTETSTGDATTNITNRNGETSAELALAPDHQTNDAFQMVSGGVRPGTPEDDDDENTPRNELLATPSTTSVTSAATPRGRGRGGRRAGRARAGSRGRGRGRGRSRSNYETRGSRNVIDTLTGFNAESEDTPMPDA